MNIENITTLNAYKTCQCNLNIFELIIKQLTKTLVFDIQVFFWVKVFINNNFKK